MPLVLIPVGADVVGGGSEDFDAGIPRYHRQPAGAGVRARHRRLEAAAATPSQAASAPGALKRSPEMVRCGW